jgi:hypothetical protein
MIAAMTTIPAAYTTGITTIVAVVTGSLLNEIHAALTARRQSRQAAGRVLAELLDIRHRMVLSATVLAELRKRGMPPGTESQVREIFAGLLPDMDGLQARFNEAVTDLAASSPLLAFRLRPQSSIDGAFASLRGLAKDYNASPLVVAQLETALRLPLEENLTTLTRDLAYAHGWGTWLRVRRRQHAEAKDFAKKLGNVLERLKTIPNETHET